MTPPTQLATTLLSAVALVLSSCAVELAVRSPTITPMAAEVAEHRAIARKALTMRLDWTARAGQLTRQLGRSGLDRCRRGNELKAAEDFAAKCTLTLYRAYTWNGDLDALLDRFQPCPATAEIRNHWRAFGGKAHPRDGSHIYDIDDLPPLICAGVTIEFASSHTEKDPDLTVMPGANVFDDAGGRHAPYYWVPEGTPWLASWLRVRGEGQYLVAMQVSEDYSALNKPSHDNHDSLRVTAPETREGPHPTVEPFSNNCPAVTYSPTPSRVQYHRRWEA
ncbi:hypothetical protein GCM10012289_76250 [Nonomuraea cavernae]|uniref:Uncharacterized protein n=1 Tax=Nonomuraea cavernae TaxID=2045107 RepID=A0A917ZJP1_9ACTN|nr:hypothetical protein GCM10012289_76250 [Nonomuraea cavernae]